MNGIVFKGIDDWYYALSDHRHSTDVSRAPLHFPDTARNQYKLTGEPRSTTPPDTDASDWIATTKKVRKNFAGLVYVKCNTRSTISEKQVTVNSSYGDQVYFNKQIGSSICIRFIYDIKGLITLNIHNTKAEPVLCK